jgi:hypothetical protein
LLLVAAARVHRKVAHRVAVALVAFDQLSLTLVVAEV